MCARPIRELPAGTRWPFAFAAEVAGAYALDKTGWQHDIAARSSA
jgi:hypothetical protein